MKAERARTYLALAIVAVLLAAFGFVAGDVIEGETRWFDDALLLGLRVPGHPDTPIGPHWLLEAARDVTALGGYTVLTILVTAVVAYLLLTRQRIPAALIAGAVISGTIISNAVKAFVDRPRPDLIHLVEVTTPSFPSGHAMLSAVTYLTVGAVLAAATRDRPMQAFFIGLALFLTLIVGASRVYLGVHYPTDVLAGWSLGAAWALFCFILSNAISRRRGIELDPER